MPMGGGGMPPLGPPGGGLGPPGMGGGGPQQQPAPVKVIPTSDVWKLLEKVVKKMDGKSDITIKGRRKGKSQPVAPKQDPDAPLLQ